MIARVEEYWTELAERLGVSRGELDAMSVLEVREHLALTEALERSVEATQGTGPANTNGDAR